MLVPGRGGNRTPNKERGQLLLATPSQYFCRNCEMSNTEEIHNNTSYYTPKTLITKNHFLNRYGLLQHILRILVSV